MSSRSWCTRAAQATAVSIAVVLCLATVSGTAGFAAATSDTKVVVKPPAGAAKPVPGTGMGTQAALDDPRCNTGEAYSVYGRWDTSSVGTGPACVRPFAQGEKNGGETAPGVTAKSVSVVAVLPAAGARDENLRGSAPPILRANNAASSWESVVHDYLYAYHDFYEQWGRSIDVQFYQSTGADETAQRADAVAILGMKPRPFAVINFDSAGLSVLAQALADKKVLVHAYALGPKESAAQAPYRWGGNDPDSAAFNGAEVIGKDLVGKKAEFGGDDVKDQTRKFGLLAISTLVDLDSFKAQLKKNKVPLTSEAIYDPSPGGTVDAAAIAQQAPTYVQKMKAAGVTTVVLLGNRLMEQAFMGQATQQDWYPEYFFSGVNYNDLPVLAQAYPKDQAEHGFGISLIGPYFDYPKELAAFSGVNGAYNWFWGPGVGSTSGLMAAGLTWLMSGIHYAGPDLTVKTFQQGLFASPPVGGNPKDPLTGLSGYGRTTGLPYDAYSPGPADFMAFFMDPHTTAISPGTGSSTPHASFYPDGAPRYHSGQWPKNIKWFDKKGAITTRDTYPPGAPPLTAAPACASGQCPATGATSPTVGSDGKAFSVAPNPAATGTA